MGWAVGYDTNWHRDVGYGVPAACDYPDCGAQINRGLSYVCGDAPFGGEYGCGLYFCGELQYTAFDPETGRPVTSDDDDEDEVDEDALEWVNVCPRCRAGEQPFEPTPDVEEWTHHKATDPSWAKWREEHADA